ncbi:unnamed protein product [Paramecium octaurelia]|uniref:EF-hand domain-containing protein n=1 Tax=Paramecium octaurelia TaxID=43137 RepID=A0A8S1T8B1_PAROT|nr:unnamed protein product [Paramecium octaurelia]
MDIRNLTNKKPQLAILHTKNLSKQFSMKSEKRIKTTTSDSNRSVDTKKILTDFYDSCKRRKITSQFIHERNKSQQHQNESLFQSIDSWRSFRQQTSTSHVSPPNKFFLFNTCEKVLCQKSNGSKRIQTQYAEKLFLQQLNSNNKQELLLKIEQYIRDYFTDECREMANLFDTFMRELNSQISDQKFQLTLHEKQLEIQKLDEIIKMNTNHTWAHQDMERQLKQLQSQHCEQMNLIAKYENENKDLQIRNNQLKQQLDIKQKEIVLKNKKIKELGYEVLQLQRKLEYVENKVQKDHRQSIQQIRYSIFQSQQIGSNSNLSQTGNNNNNQPNKFTPLIEELVEDSSPSLTEQEDEEEKELNQIEFNTERIVETREKESQVEYDIINNYTKEQDTQTCLKLVERKFDDLTQDLCEQALNFIDFLNVHQDKVEIDMNQVNANLSNINLEKVSDEEIVKYFDQQALLQSNLQLSTASQNHSQLVKQPSIRGNMKRTSMIIDRPSIQNQQQLPNQIKIKSMITFIKMQGSKMKQLETQLKEGMQQIEGLKLINNNLEDHNKEIKEQNSKLLDQITNLHVKVNDLENQIMSDAMDINQVLSQQEKRPPNIKQNTFAQRKTKKAAPHLGQKITISYDFQKNQSKLLIEKIKSKSMGKFSNYLPLKLVLKMITTFYFEKISNQKENKQLRDQDMSSYIYNYYLQQFGYTKVTEQRFMILVLSVKKYISIVRVNLFAKFMNLLEEKSNYRVEELQRYLEALEYVSNIQNLGIAIKDNEQEQKHYIPYVRALAYLGQLQNFNFTQEELNYLKLELENQKEIDPKNMNKAGIIDFDLLMIRVLTIFRNNVEKTKLYVINAFAACDLDGNGMCNIDEWLLLIRHIEPEKFDEEKFIDIFEEFADLVEEDEKNLSFDRFSILCMEHELFSDAQQNKFLRVKSNQEADQKLEQIKQNWGQIYMEQLKRLNEIKMEENEKQKWQKILGVLDKKLSDQHSSKKPLLIAYKIFLEESK